MLSWKLLKLYPNRGNTFLNKKMYGVSSMRITKESNKKINEYRIKQIQVFLLRLFKHDKIESWNSSFALDFCCFTWKKENSNKCTKTNTAIYNMGKGNHT